MQNYDNSWNKFNNPEEGHDFPDDLQYQTKHFKKNSILFHQGDLCEHLYIITHGSVKTEMLTENGNILGIEIIKAPRPLAPAFLFSTNNRFPVTVYAIEELELLCIPKAEVMRLIANNPDFMKQFLEHNANRTQFLSNRLQLLSIKSLKGKIAHFLIEQADEYGDQFTLNRNKTELAEFFCVARPSLSRTFSELIDDGIIEIHHNNYKIKDKNALRNLMI